MLSLKGVLFAMQHKSLCRSIQELIARNQACSDPSSSENGQYVTHLTPRQHTTVAKLVGKRCIINCKLNELEQRLSGIQVPKFLYYQSDGLQDDFLELNLEILKSL